MNYQRECQTGSTDQKANTVLQPRFSEPLTNLSKDEHAYFIEIALPGFTLDEVNVEIEDSILKVKSVMYEEEDKDNKFIRKGFVKRNFELKYNLSNEINSNEINAKLEHGILRISCPIHVEMIKTKKQIKIQSV